MMWPSCVLISIYLIISGESYLLSGLEDVAAPACVLLSRWLWGKQLFPSVCTTAEHHTSEARWERYRQMKGEGEWEGWGWSGERWFASLLCSAWRRTHTGWSVSIIFLLWPCSLSSLVLSSPLSHSLLSWFSLHIVVLSFTFPLKAALVNYKWLPQRSEWFL